MSSFCRIGEFAEKIGRSVSTVRRWESDMYCRVSSASQRTDLASQRAAIEQFFLARSLPMDRWATEVDGGVNLARPTLLTGGPV